MHGFETLFDFVLGNTDAGPTWAALQLKGIIFG